MRKCVPKSSGRYGLLEEPEEKISYKKVKGVFLEFDMGVCG